MTSADTETPTAGEPDGIEEMQSRREQRKARRRRTVPEPHHPRPRSADSETGTADSNASTDTTAPTESEQPEAKRPAPEPEQSPTGPDTPPDEPDVTEPDAAAVERTEEKGPELASAAPDPAAGRPTSGQAVSVPPAAAGTAKTASDAALSWAAAARKQAVRLDGLVTAVNRARAEGVPSLVLNAALADAEYRAGVSLPPEVWAAAEEREG